MVYSRSIPELTVLSAPDLLDWAFETYNGRFAIVTSFQLEGMILIEMAAKLGRGVRVITLDTGRLPAETHEMIETVRARYSVEVECVAPEAAEVESMVARFGPNLFYRDVPLRRLCCQIRKTRPLERKLATLDAWATGLRRAQAQSRFAIEKVESAGGRLKLNPLADWTKDDVERYTRDKDIPRHPLYAQGYTSIGCAPCTRPTQTGEDERAGRWWWELDAAKECGIHFSPEGRAERTVDVLLRDVLASAAKL